RPPQGGAGHLHVLLSGLPRRSAGAAHHRAHRRRVALGLAAASSTRVAADDPPRSEAYVLAPSVTGAEPAPSVAPGVRLASRRLVGLQIVRSPKIAVPTRTIVAPAAIASTKSLDMPIDSSRSPAAAASCARLSKNGRGGTPSGGMHIKPSHRTCGRAANARTSAGTSVIAQPLFCVSPPI